MSLRPFITLITRSIQSYGEDKCNLYAAAIAYYAVFALLPIALVGVGILGYFIGDEAAREHVIDAITNVVALGDAGEATLENTLQGVSRASGWLGLVGLVLAVWSAGVLFGHIRAALDDVWGLKDPPVLRAKLRDLILFIGFTSLLLASTVITGVLVGLWGHAEGWPAPLHGIVGLLLVVMTRVSPFTFAAFLFLHRFGTHAKLRWRDVVPAALITTLFFELGKNVFAFYVVNFGTLNALAGSLGAAILLLVWLSYSARVTLFAAELSKHRKLVRAGLMPAVDPAAETRRSISDYVKEAVVHLWEDETTAAALPVPQQEKDGRPMPPPAQTMDDAVSARPVPVKDRET
jgi:membrane protein